MQNYIVIKGAKHNNLKNINVKIPKYNICVVTGVSGSGKSSLVFDTIVSEAQRRFFHTLSYYTRQYLDVANRAEVDYIHGLSPCISLAQHETLPTKRATVATFTDIGELIGVLFSQFGEKYCPTHKLLTTPIKTEEILNNILNNFINKIIVISAPIAQNQKGNFKKTLESFVKKGFVNAIINGKETNLIPTPELSKEQKHTIKLIVDVTKCEPKNKDRLTRSINTALEISKGYLEVCEFLDTLENSFANAQNIKMFSQTHGCPVCQMSWPAIDSRYFSPNSLGKCPHCNGLGYINNTDNKHDFALDNFENLFEEPNDNNENEFPQNEYDVNTINFVQSQMCSVCKGTGLNPQLSYITINNVSAIDMHLMDFNQLLKLLEEISDKFKDRSNPAFEVVTEQLKYEISKIIDLDLGYLAPSRRILSLSFGELQRLKLSSIIVESLRGILYVLDEPSQGLHPKEINSLLNALKTLKSNGNTVIVVDHDEILMQNADWIIDLGPSGGYKGGEIVAEFNSKDASKYTNISLTAKYLVSKNCIKNNADYACKQPSLNDEFFITVYHPTLNNLKIDSVHFAKNKLNVICGVSGAGKSSLVAAIYEDIKNLINSTPTTTQKFNKLKDEEKKTASELQKKFLKFCKTINGINNIKKIELIDRTPISKTTTSMPATYLDVFSVIRNIFSTLPQTQLAGIQPHNFSLAKEGGRCEECKGRGEIILHMRFLADAKIKCPICNGSRYKDYITQIKYKNLSIADVLNLTIEEAVEFFKHKTQIIKKLQPACDLGLGYLKLGQSSSSLSGGEAQRLKLVPYFAKTYGENSILIIEEPTSGLHFEDVNMLVKALNHIKSLGTTIIVIENNIDFILASDWVVELGPGSAQEGGKLIFEGSLNEILQNPNSIISNWLKDKINVN